MVVLAAPLAAVVRQMIGRPLTPFVHAMNGVKP